MELVTDIGGTNMRVAVVKSGVLGDVHKVHTPKEPSEGIAALAALARESAGSEPIEQLAGCIAGTVSDLGVISDARNLRAWEGTNVVEALSLALQAPVTLINDAGAAGLGEALFGAGRGADDSAYVTVSTGVGGAHIQHGRVVAAGGVARIQIDGEDIEDLISGTAVRRRLGIDPKELESIDERNALADVLARGLQRLHEEWRPSRFVLGGSMIVGINPIPIERVARTLATLLADAEHLEVRKAELGDNGGLWGGVALLRAGAT